MSQGVLLIFVPAKILSQAPSHNMLVRLTGWYTLKPIYKSIDVFGMSVE